LAPGLSQELPSIFPVQSFPLCCQKYTNTAVIFPVVKGREREILLLQLELTDLRKIAHAICASVFESRLSH